MRSPFLQLQASDLWPLCLHFPAWDPDTHPSFSRLLCDGCVLKPEVPGRYGNGATQILRAEPPFVWGF